MRAGGGVLKSMSTRHSKNENLKWMDARKHLKSRVNSKFSILHLDISPLLPVSKSDAVAKVMPFWVPDNPSRFYPLRYGIPCRIVRLNSMTRMTADGVFRAIRRK